jgi:hypothetical protein
MEIWICTSSASGKEVGRREASMKLLQLEKDNISSSSTKLCKRILVQRPRKAQGWIYAGF